MYNPIILGFFAALIFFFICLWILIIVDNKVSAKLKEDKKNKVRSQKLFLKSVMVSAILFLIVSFISPFFFTNSDFFNNKDVSVSKPISGIIDGLMNPFIAISAVIVTGLAFYMQYQANQQLALQIKDQSKKYLLDKFESQFYEMLRLHKENINEMSIEGYIMKKKYSDEDAQEFYKAAKKDRDRYKNSSESSEIKEIEGRKIFYLMVREFDSIYRLIQKVAIKRCPQDVKVENESIVFVNTSKEIYLWLAYFIFFNGKEVFERVCTNKGFNENEKGENFKTDFLEELLREVRTIRICHKNGVRYIENFIEYNNCKESLHIDFSYKPYGGHHIRLAHYYRHMFNLVKHVVDQPNDLLSYEDKRRYLKIFRAQLSNHEVVLLYYNWLSEFGKEWEEEKSKGEFRNRYFTDYRIIHNLNGEFVLEEFHPKYFEINNLDDFLYIDLHSKVDDLFELHGIKSCLTVEENLSRKAISKS